MKSIVIHFAMLIGTLLNPSLMLGQTSPQSMNAIFENYCRNKTRASCSANKGDPVDEVAFVLSCRKYYEDNRCKEVQESLGESRREEMISCEPDRICFGQDDSTSFNCVIDGVKTQFTLPNLMFIGGFTAASAVGGVASSVVNWLAIPVLAYSAGKSAEQCNADRDFKKMAIKMHNLSLMDFEKQLDFEDQDLLKMPCDDLKAFLQNRLDTLSQRRAEHKMWDLNGQTQELPPGRKAMLELLQSNKCLSSAALKIKTCEAFGGLLAGVVTGVGTAKAGKLMAKGSAAIKLAKAEAQAAHLDALNTLVNKYPNLKEYPSFSERILKARKRIENYTDQQKILEKGNAFDVRLQSKELPEDPKLKKTVEDVFNRLNNKAEMAAYVEKLMMDSFESALKRKDPEELKALEKGLLKRKTVLKVLVERARVRGETLSTVTSMDEKKFYQQVSSGPFFDKGLKFSGNSNAKLHGIDSHLLQRDAVADVVEKGVGSKQFYEYLGNTKEGKVIWKKTFDRGPDTRNNYSSPAGVQTIIAPFLGLE